MNNLELKKVANEVRKGIVTAVHSAKAGHPGGSLSAADIFTFLYLITEESITVASLVREVAHRRCDGGSCFYLPSLSYPNTSAAATRRSMSSSTRSRP